jgi:histidine triad (HIT) family protein
LRCEGINLLLADGAVAGQEVFHSHLHVVPRWSGDGFGYRFRAGHGSPVARAALDAAAARIRERL